MGVHHVEGPRGEAEGAEVAGHELDVGGDPRRRPRAWARADGHHVGGDVDADHPPRRHPGGQVDGEGAGAAADVEQVHARA